VILGGRTAAAFASVVIVGLATAALGAPAHAVEDAAPQLDPTLTAAAGTQIAWAQVGDGPVLLMLNGTASPMSEWDPALLSALAQEHRVIVLDYPGLGLSGPAPQAWTFANAADWIAELLPTISADAPVDVLGWSMGGFIAQQLAIRHPERVRSLILAATNPGGHGAVLGPPWVQEADSSGGVSAYLRTNYPPGHRSAGRRFLDRLADAVASGAYPQERVPASTARAMVRAEDPWLRSDANADALAGVRAPTLVITGADDLITPAVNSRRIAKRIPGAKLILVARSGHSFLFQRPALTAATVSGFLLR